jgi:hypothetical protein
MADRNVSWVPSAHVRFGSLDFVITSEVELARVLAPQSPPDSSLKAVVKVVEKLQLNPPEARTPERDRLLDFDFMKLEHQLAIYLGPRLS